MEKTFVLRGEYLEKTSQSGQDDYYSGLGDGDIERGKRKFETYKTIEFIGTNPKLLKKFIKEYQILIEEDFVKDTPDSDICKNICDKINTSYFMQETFK